MVLFIIATIKSRVQGHHVNSYKNTISEELECKLEAQNKYGSHVIMVLAKKKKQRVKRKNKKKIE